ncbi:MAG TPA: Uma2 family endonuclease, partial [Thermoanaerobaculia bacterium]|nr:Uma2 family endonuclease [Thermoanaerobaculia bacterium]
KESAREERTAASDAARRADARRQNERHAIELSLARIADQLRRTTHPERRAALEAARRELEAKRDALR